MVAVSLSNLHLLASLLNLWTYVANDSSSVCWMSMNWLIEVWMSALDIFKQRASLISSQLLCAIKASDINILTRPRNLACANLVLLSFVNLAAVSISVNQSSSCQASCPFRIGMFCNKVFSRDVFFCAVHKVSVYQSSTFSIGVC